MNITFDGHTHQHVHSPTIDPEKLARAQRNAWRVPTAIGVTTLAAVAYVIRANPNQPGGFPICPLKSMTGLDCPGCGGLRCTYALAHGDFGAALDHNALAALLLPLIATLMAVWLLRGLSTSLKARGHELSLPVLWLRFNEGLDRVMRPLSNGLATTYIIGFLLVWATVRNISAVPFLHYLSSETS